MKRLIVLVVIVIACAGIWMALSPGFSNVETRPRVRVERGSIARTAVAVGRVEAEHEIAVKSPNGGLLTKLHVKLGDRVERGQALAEVRPVETSRNLLQAERAVEAARMGEENAREFAEGKHLSAWLMRLFTGEKSLERMHRGAELSLRQAEENLELLKEGAVRVDQDHSLDFVVRAPASGNVVDLRVREGGPVVPSSSYGSGSVLLVIADLRRPIFKGTVDEIDVGRLKVGMKASVTIGALPDTTVPGTLAEIALKGSMENNAMVFPVRIALEPGESTVLRLGYSAVAHLEIERRSDVLVIPERVVEFREGAAFVLVPGTRGDGGRAVERPIETGLSDGLVVEVVHGLDEGDEVLERIR